MFRGSKRKSRFNVLEVGFGKTTEQLAKKALARKSRNKRFFTGIEKGGFAEYSPARNELTLAQYISEKIFKKKAKVRNLAIINGDALFCAEKLAPESQHLIFGSYFMNNIPIDMYGINARKQMLETFQRWLIPGGRIVLVQNKGEVLSYRELSTQMGFGFHSIPLKESECLASPSSSIQTRATPEKRTAYMNKPCERARYDSREIDALVQKGLITSPQDYFSPTLVLLRKPGIPKRS